MQSSEWLLDVDECCVNLLYRNATGVSGESAIMDKLREMKNSFRG